MTHEMATHPEPFQAILDRRVLFDIRSDDRDFAIGDILVLREWDPGTDAKYPNGFTGRELSVRLTSVARGRAWGLPEGLCVLGLAPAPANPPCRNWTLHVGDTLRPLAVPSIAGRARSCTSM